MDLDVDEGIELNREMIISPNKTQRASYVAMSLFYAIKSDNGGMNAATCADQANRLPELKKYVLLNMVEKLH